MTTCIGAFVANSGTLWRQHPLAEIIVHATPVRRCLSKGSAADNLAPAIQPVGQLEDVHLALAPHIVKHRTKGGTDMHMRIVWGKILPGQWDAFEAAFKKALEIRGEAKGLKSQWLLRDQNDPDAGYSISQWESDEDMRAFWDSKQRSDAMAVIQPFFVNQFTITNCEVRVTVNH